MDDPNHPAVDDDEQEEVCCLGCCTKRQCEEYDYTWLYQDVALLVLGGLMALASFGAWLNDATQISGGVETWRIPALLAIVIIAAPFARLVQAAVFRVLQLCTCTKACRDLNFIISSMEGIPAMFCLTAVVGWAASGPVLDLPTSGLSDAQRDTQAWISRAFGCVLTVSLVLGARRALVRYALWGVLQRTAQEQAQQLDRLQAVAMQLTSSLRPGWHWPSLAVAATGNGAGSQSSDASAPSGNTGGPAANSITPLPSLSSSSSSSTGHRRSYGPGGVAVDLDPSSGTGAAEKEDPEVAQARLKRIKLRLHDARGRPHSVQREDLVRSIARKAFRALARSKQAVMPAAFNGDGDGGGDEEGSLGGGGPVCRPAAHTRNTEASTTATSGAGASNDGASGPAPSKNPVAAVTSALGVGQSLLSRGIHLMAGTENSRGKHDDVEEGDEELELVEGDFRLVLQDPDLADEAFPYFDASEDGNVNIDEFEAGFAQIFKAFQAAKSSVAGGGAVSGAMDTVADILFYLVAAVLILTYAGVSVNSIFVPIASIILASSFALESVISDTVASFVFVVVVRAYDVGDRIVAEGVRDEQVLVVEAVDILTTTFTIPASGRRVSVPNHVLAGTPIENLKRSPKVTLTSHVQVAHDATAQQLDAVRADVERFVGDPSRGQEWKPGAKLFVESVEGAGEGSSQLRLRIQARPRRAWQELQKVRKLRSELLMAFVDSTRAHGVKFITEDEGGQQPTST